MMDDVKICHFDGDKLKYLGENSERRMRSLSLKVVREWGRTKRQGRVLGDKLFPPPLSDQIRLHYQDPGKVVETTRT